MFCFSRGLSTSAACFVLGFSGSAIAPLITATPAAAQSNFSDVGFSYWARPFIEELAQKNIIAGFPDGTFKPDAPVTRAQFAAIVRQAFDEDRVRQYLGFRDVPSGYWATPAIEKAYTTRFMSGYPDNTFRPNEQIPRVQALVSLASGLELDPDDPVEETLDIYRDAADIPGYAKSGIAASTEQGLVVNYPNLKFFNPNQVATRADIAAFVYQALVDQGTLAPIAESAKVSSYIVKGSGTHHTGTSTGQTQTGQLIAQGTRIQVKYPGTAKVKLVLAANETVSTSLEVAESIVNAQGNTLIPEGSLISGRLQPLTINNTAGTQFIAEQLKIGDRSYAINAISNPVVATDQSVDAADVRGGLITDAARSVLGTLLGSGVDLGSLLAGVLGTSGGATSSNSKNVIIVDPSELVITTQADLRLATHSLSTPVAVNFKPEIKALR